MDSLTYAVHYNIATTLPQHLSINPHPIDRFRRSTPRTCQAEKCSHHNDQEVTNSAQDSHAQPPAEMQAEAEAAHVATIRAAWRKAHPSPTPETPQFNSEYHNVQSAVQNLLQPLEYELACRNATNTTILGDELFIDSIRETRDLATGRGGRTRTTLMLGALSDEINLANFELSEITSRKVIVLEMTNGELLFHTHWKGTDDQRKLLESYLVLRKNKAVETDRLLSLADAAKVVLRCFKTRQQRQRVTGGMSGIHEGE
jgi:hypothetical protein